MTIICDLEVRRGGNAQLYDYVAPGRTAGNGKRTAWLALFFGWPDRRKPRISAENEEALAVNFGKNSETRGLDRRPVYASPWATDRNSFSGLIFAVEIDADR